MPRLLICRLSFLLIGVLVVSGCSNVFSDDNASDKLTPPKTGACRDLIAEDLTSPSNAAPTISCNQDHTAQTFAVGSLPRSTGTSYDDKRHGRFVYDACQAAFRTFLGADESLAIRSQLSWAWFRPSELGWERGARWYRCDVVGGPPGAKTLRNLPATTKDLFAEDRPDAWLTCAAGPSVSGSNQVPCTARHDWRAVTTVKIGKPEDAYPGDRIVEVRSRDYCRDSVRGWLGYPPDFQYGYTWFHQDRWDGGNRRAICWSRTTK